MLDYNTYWSENMKVVEQSLYDVATGDDEFLPESTDFKYNEEYEQDYKDNKLSGNILNHINGDAYTELRAKFTGEHTYYETFLFNSNWAYRQIWQACLSRLSYRKLIIWT